MAGTEEEEEHREGEATSPEAAGASEAAAVAAASRLAKAGQAHHPVAAKLLAVDAGWTETATRR